MIFNWNGKQVEDLVKKALIDGGKDAGENVLEESNRMVPHDEGTLMRSGQVSVDEEKLDVFVSYDTPYAVKLHENPQYNFQQGRQGKWLEQGLKNRQSAIQEFLKAKLSEALKG